MGGWTVEGGARILASALLGHIPPPPSPHAPTHSPRRSPPATSTPPPYQWCPPPSQHTPPSTPPTHSPRRSLPATSTLPPSQWCPPPSQHTPPSTPPTHSPRRSLPATSTLPPSQWCSLPTPPHWRGGRAHSSLAPRLGSGCRQAVCCVFVCVGGVGWGDGFNARRGGMPLPTCALALQPLQPPHAQPPRPAPMPNPHAQPPRPTPTPNPHAHPPTPPPLSSPPPLPPTPPPRLPPHRQRRRAMSLSGWRPSPAAAARALRCRLGGSCSWDCS